MAVFILYQGQKFEVAQSLGDRHAVQDHIQQKLMYIRFIESAWVKGMASELPLAWLPRDLEGERSRSTQKESESTSSIYTVYPEDRGDGVVYNPYLTILLANENVLSILVHDYLEIAVMTD